MAEFRRPPMTTLPENAVIPPRNIISPPPNQFTHRLRRAQPYFYDRSLGGNKPDGHLSVGSQVVLLVYDGGAYCRVADARGLYVETEYDGVEHF